MHPYPTTERNTPMTYHQLSQKERYTIAALLRTHCSSAEMARELGRSTSTITRELIRNRRPNNTYCAEVAQSYTTARRKRTRRGSNFSEAQWEVVLMLIQKDYSPEQASYIIKHYFGFSISHETIYQYLLYDKKRGGTMYRHLRIMPKRRRKRYNSHDSRGILPGKRMISERPASIARRARIGHWEGDTVMGLDRHFCIVTLVERKSGFVIIKKCKERTVAEVNAVCRAALHEHGRKFRTITFDNGTEFHGYEALERCFPITCYFAHPYHSWERGTNENTNGLIRQYLPKGHSMRYVTQAACDRIAYILNTRPRKRLGFKTPYEVFYRTSSPLHFTLESRILEQIQTNTFFLSKNIQICIKFFWNQS